MNDMIINEQPMDAIVEDATSSENLKKAKRKKRTVNFPVISYEESLEIGKAIWQFASGSKVRRLTLFDSMKRSPDSSISRKLITASAKYQITTGSYGAEFLELTPEGRMATDPDEDAIRKLDASFKLAIGNNEFFLKLYNKYKGNRMPVLKVMSDFLYENGLPLEECTQCVEMFITNGRYIGIIDVIAGSERIVSIDHLKERIKTDDTSKPEERKLDFATESCADLATDSSDNTTQHANNWDKTCFFIAPIGEDGSEQRMHSDLFLEQIIEPVLDQFGLDVVRADRIDSAGMITSQIIEHIIRSRIVIADLSFHNPNVFYELSLRHAQNKPTIHLIRKCDKIPFDINNFRTIVIDDTSIYTLVPQLESYKAMLSSQIRKFIDHPDEFENPISAYYQANQ